MAVGAVLATALTTHATRSFGLFVDNFDVTGVGGVTSWGTDYRTITLEERGPGGVSNLSFVVDDPDLVVTIDEGQVVRMHDYFADLPLFLGFVQAWTVEVQGTGRRITVKCIGIEALLDWMIVPTYTNNTPGPNGWNNSWRSELSPARAVVSAGYEPRMVQSLASVSSSLEFPITSVSNFQMFVDVQNVTFRELFRQIFASEQSGAVAAVYRVTVDFWGNLRVFQTNDIPDDYATLTINDAPAGPIVAGALRHDGDATGTIHRVYVQGSGAGTGLVTDGSGVPGPIAYLNDPMSTTAALLASIGAQYLFRHDRRETGRLMIDTWKPTTNIRAGSTVTITDAQIPLAAEVFTILSIKKRFDGAGLQTWEVAYGALPPSASDLIRQLTRDVRS